MKLVKSLLLGSAAGLVAVAGASAADLGVKKPTAVEYVKTCPTYGAGFFVVPGTTSCLKIVGRVRADYIFENPRTRANNHNRFRMRGYVGFDHRTATEYGLLRTYVRAFFQRENAADSTTLEYAFVQFGGFTFGRVTPIFEHGWNQFYLFSGQGGFGYHSDISYTNSIGYTFNMGGGFSASIALDDSRERRVHAGGAGHIMPDIVGALVLNPGWGTARSAGAVFQNRSITPTVDSKIGFAAEAGLKVNLPMLNKGSNIWVSGGFSQGSTSYNGFGGTFTIGSFTGTSVDTVTVGTSLKQTVAYHIGGALQVFVMPTVSISLGGFYANQNPNGANNSIKTMAVIGQVAWNPAPGFLIGLEGAYRAIQRDAGAAVAAVSGNKKNDFVGRLRVQRDF